MRIYRKWNIVPIILIAALVSGWWCYTNTDAFRARKLITELSHSGISCGSPTAGERLIFVASLTAPNTRTLGEVMDELAAMGKSAVPFLIDELRPGRNRYGLHGKVSLALAAIGRPSVRPLLGVMQELGDSGSDMQMRMQITEAIGKIGPDAEEAIPALVSDLQSSDALARGLAAEALFRIDHQRALKEVLPRVLEDARSDDPSARCASVFTLRKIGPVTPEAAEAIQQLKLDDRYRFAFDGTP